MDIKLDWKKRFLWIPPLAIGVCVLLFASSFQQAPPQTKKAAPPKTVRIMKISPHAIQPFAIGYGYIQAATSWQAQAELSGTVSWVSNSLENGAIVREGEELLKIDPTPYLLSRAQLQAQFDVVTIKDKTIHSSLKIAQQDFELQKAELARNERLSKTGNVSTTARDASKRQFLSSQQQLQTLKNALLINRAEKKVLRSQLELVDLDLEKTTILAPYDMRLTEVNVGFAEYINRGDLLFKADGLDAAEVSAQFPIGKMRPLRKVNATDSLNNQHAALTASVELQAVDRIIAWQGKVDRTGGLLDAETQSQSIVVRIEEPYQQSSPGKRPPLLQNTFVKVTLKAPVLKKQILLPITAIHNNKVYLLDDDNKLLIKEVEVDFVQQQIAVIRQGLKVGDNVILSALSPAISGMKLKPKLDKKIQQWLDSTTGFRSKNQGLDKNSSKKSNSKKQGTGKKEAEKSGNTKSNVKKQKQEAL